MLDQIISQYSQISRLLHERGWQKRELSLIYQNHGSLSETAAPRSMFYLVFN